MYLPGALWSTKTMSFWVTALTIHVEFEFNVPGPSNQQKHIKYIMFRKIGSNLMHISYIFHCHTFRVWCCLIVALFSCHRHVFIPFMSLLLFLFSPLADVSLLCRCLCGGRHRSARDCKRIRTHGT